MDKNNDLHNQLQTQLAKFLETSRQYTDDLERERNKLRAEVAHLKEEQKKTDKG